MPTYIDNRKAYFDYEVLETIEAGVELFGYEVKSIKAKQGNLQGAYVLIRGGEAYLAKAFVPPFQEKNTPAYDTERVRRLLLNKQEIKRLAEIDKKLTIVPISMYSKGKNIKVEIAIVRGKKKCDKRETIKKRETDRDIRRTLKNQ